MMHMFTSNSHFLKKTFQMGLMKKHPSIIPFMIYISNEGKHTERFAVRAKYMTLDPTNNNDTGSVSRLPLWCVQGRVQGKAVSRKRTQRVGRPTIT
jgi:hypothetical protein